MTEVIRTNTLFSILWSVLSRWSSKLIGMVSTIILARLLTPADFGIIAMATLVIALLDALTQAGLNLYILRLNKPTDSDYNSVWTVGIMQGLIIALPLFSFAPVISEFYQQPNLTQVIYCLATIRILQGFNNVGLIIAQKHLNFKIDFVHTLYSRFTYLLATVASAIMLQSYWSIVIGMLASTLVGIVSSYFLHPFRPRLSFSGFRGLFRYSKTTIPLSIGRYVNNQADSLAVGRFASADFLGIYHIATNLAGMFTKELLIPVIRGLIPNLSIQREQDNFAQVLQLTFASAIYVFLPVGVGLAMVSYEFVYIVLGQGWISAAPLLFWFSLHGMLSGLLMFFSEQFLVIMEKEKLSNQLMWSRNLFTLLCITLTFTFGEIVDLPRNLFFTLLAYLPIVLIIISRVLKFSPFGLMLDFVRPLMALIVMIVCISLVPDSFNQAYWLLLVLKVIAGMVGYVGSLLLFCVFFGIKDNSVESASKAYLFPTTNNR